MRQSSLKVALAGLALLASHALEAATLRGQLRCNNGDAPAVGIAVTVNGVRGRTTPFFTGGDGMYYITDVPAGQYVLEIWLSKRGNDPTSTQQIIIKEPITDVPPQVVPVCSAQ